MTKARPPTVFGPARTGPVQRVIVGLAGASLAGFLIWLAGTDMGLRDFDLPGPSPLDKGQKILLLLAALVLVAAGIGMRAPFTTAVIQVSDTGITTRQLGRQRRDPAFVRFALLDRIEVTPMRGGEHGLTITAREGADRRWFKIRSHDMTGAQGPEIAREIARRAKASGVTVHGPEPGRALAFESIWRFAPPGENAD